MNSHSKAYYGLTFITFLPKPMAIKWYLVVISVYVFLVVNEAGCVHWPRILPPTVNFETALSANVTENVSVCGPS